MDSMNGPVPIDQGGVVMVLRAGRSGDAEARAAIGDLRAGGERVLGAVLNREGKSRRK